MLNIRFPYIICFLFFSLPDATENKSELIFLEDYNVRICVAKANEISLEFLSISLKWYLFNIK